MTIMASLQQQTVHVIPLDHLEAVFAASGDIAKAKVQAVKNDPPRVIYTTQPALLILVDGAPILKPLVGSYQRIVNTRPVLLLSSDPLTGGYYLYADANWYASPSIDGPWVMAANPPMDINDALAAAVATKQVDTMLPKNPNAPPVANVYVSTVPAELIQTTGVPNLLAVPNTDLLYVANTSSAIFYYLDDANYYVLISGRWFKAVSLNGPYAYVVAGALPADFQRIPADSEKSNVLPSVPGTPQAAEAVIANSIPETAAIERAQAQLTVDYVGAPNFVGIAGTSLAYSVNTAIPVIMVSAKSYYACQSGVWFTAPSALGPWQVATSVPGAIYTIPPSCPIHYVTYAYVYSSTPTLVYVGYTPGYAGTVVAPGGVVVYGTGYYYPPVVVGTTYVSYPPTYGYGASMAMGAAVGFAFGYAAGANSSCWCEPHWGCYSVSSSYSYTHVNVNSTSFYTSYGTAVHATGSYGYNAYTGTKWASQSASTFNPYTGTSASGSRSAAYNPYTGNAAASKSGSAYNSYSGAAAKGSSSFSGNAYTGNYNANRQGAGYNPTTGNYGAAQTSVSGNAKNGTASVSSSGTVGNTKTGNSASWNNGIMTSDKNGNTYTYNQGQTSQNKSAAQSANSGSHSSWGGSSSQSSWASKESSAQATGSQRFQSYSSSGGGGWGGSRGGGGGGGRR
jgi:hypothetical protein